jgi:type I restriction enzyme S subunit
LLVEGRTPTPLSVLVTPLAARAGEQEHEVLSVTKSRGIVRAADFFTQRVASRDLSKYKLVEPGQFAYSTIHIDEGAIARNKLPIRGVVSPMYHVFAVTREDLVLPEYLDYLLRAPALLAIYRNRAGGSVRRRRSLPFPKFGAIEVPLPELDEQRRILDVIHALDEVRARYHETERAAHRLLQAERARLIDLPEHPLRQIGSLLDRIQGGKSPVCRELVPTPDEWGVLKTSAVQPSGFERDESKLLPDDVEPFEDARVRTGDVLITRSNTPDKVGLACVVDYDPGLVLMSDLIWRLECKESEVRPDYLGEALMSPRSRATVCSNAAGTSGSMKKINQAKLKRIAVPVPEDLDEQEGIAAHLADVRRAFAEARTASRVFEGTRIAVINNLVSGQDAIPESYDRLLEEADQEVAA